MPDTKALTPKLVEAFTVFGLEFLPLCQLSTFVASKDLSKLEEKQNNCVTPWLPSTSPRGSLKAPVNPS